MAVSKIVVSGYRSLRNIELPMGPVNVVTGENGCGKSNLYKAVTLIARAVQGGLGRAIAEEGGMPSVLWAGPRLSDKPIRMRLGFTTEEVSYEISLGLPIPRQTMFCLDPEVKEEFAWLGPSRRPNTTVLSRKNHRAELKPVNDNDDVTSHELLLSESTLSQVQHAESYPELTLLQSEVRGWRFYHQFDTSHGSPLRQPQAATFSPVLDDSGTNLAAALQTIREIGDGRRLDQAVAQAFSDRSLFVESIHGGNPSETEARIRMRLDSPGLMRPLRATEFSDGTLRFLCLAAALLTPRPPSLMVFNEPETSLHPDLLPAFSRLITDASKNSQIWLTTHSLPLARMIQEHGESQHIRLCLRDGETIIEQ